jgi:hypothetical protein
LTTDSRETTFLPRDDGTKPVLYFLGALFAAIIVGRLTYFFVTRDTAKLGQSLEGMAGLAVMYAAFWILRSYQQSVSITYGPAEISWKSWFGETSVPVEEIRECVIQVNRTSYGTSDKLCFVLKDGTTRRSPSFRLSLYIGFIGELERRYSFPIRRR